MGRLSEIDEEDRPFMIVDKDTGRMYDMRVDEQVEDANKKAILGSQIIPKGKSRPVAAGACNRSPDKKAIKKSIALHQNRTPLISGGRNSVANVSMSNNLNIHGRKSLFGSQITMNDIR